MHREISHVDKPFAPESRLSLYLLTGLLGVVLGLDVWPAFAAWAQDALGLTLPTWSRYVYGYQWALVAAVVGGARVLYGSIEGLLQGKVGADLALAVACIAAILFGKPLVAAEVVFVGMLGECLESITFERTQRAVRTLVEVFPRRCWLLRDGQEVRVFASDLRPGDRVVVKPGARVPADGIVLEGRSSLDLSALTGESLPADAGPGTQVLAGSLNQFGALTIEARRVSEHTVVGQVIELTARALTNKATLERTADRMARYFLPAVFALALATFLVGLGINLAGTEASRRNLFEAARRSIDPTLAVLVVACPCALILATPAAVIAALGRLAGTGVLIKGGSALERLAEVSAIAFDKTGTLTEGRLELGEIAALGSASPDEVLAAAATAEQRSEHPLARVILQEAATRTLPLAAVADFQAHPGAGVEARTEAGRLIVGTRRLLEEQGIAIPPEAEVILDRLDSAGQTPLLVARDGVMLGAIGARDRPRPEAAEVIAALRALGIHDVALLTGDRRAVAQNLATALGITEVHAELLPADKAAFLERWRRGIPEDRTKDARRVAMVGDGINDAPALAVADVGLAIGGTGSDVAAEAGDVVFMGDPLRSLPLLVELSRETLKIIRQNVVIFAFGVNVVGIVVTAWLWPLLTPLSWHSEAPLAAVIYHQFGSVAVLLNSMRLLWFGRSKSSPTIRKAKAILETTDRWIGTYLDPGEILHGLSHRWKTAAAVAALLFASGYALSGFTRVGPDEVAVVSRFGRPLDEDLGPGLHWCWPWPVDVVVRLQPERIHVVTIGFQDLKGAEYASGAWDTANRDVVKFLPDEAVMITGDSNLLELQATVRYVIADPHTYLFGARNPDEILRATAEGVLREAVAGRPFVDLMTARRGEFQNAVRRRLEDRCAEYGPHGLGLRIDGVALLDLHPPLEVVPAYHDVARAMEERDQSRNVADKDALLKVGASEAERDSQVRRAKAGWTRTRLLALADRNAFLFRLDARQLTWPEEFQLFDEAARAVARGQSPATAHADYQRRRREQVALRAALVEFRAFWDMLGPTLRNREKLILDVEKVPGKRQLMLFDPEKFRIPTPLLQRRDPEAPPGS